MRKKRRKNNNFILIFLCILQAIFISIYAFSKFLSTYEDDSYMLVAKAVEISLSSDTFSLEGMKPRR